MWGVNSRDGFVCKLSDMPRLIEKNKMENVNIRKSLEYFYYRYNQNNDDSAMLKRLDEEYDKAPDFIIGYRNINGTLIYRYGGGRRLIYYKLGNADGGIVWDEYRPNNMLFNISIFHGAPVYYDANDKKFYMWGYSGGKITDISEYILRHFERE